MSVLVPQYSTIGTVAATKTSFKNFRCIRAFWSNANPSPTEDITYLTLAQPPTYPTPQASCSNLAIAISFSSSLVITENRSFVHPIFVISVPSCRLFLPATHAAPHLHSSLSGAGDTAQSPGNPTAKTLCRPQPHCIISCLPKR